MSDSSRYSKADFLAERRRHSVLTIGLVIGLLLALVVCAAYAKTLLTRPQVVVRAPSVGFCAGHHYYHDCVATIEAEKRRYLKHLRANLGSVQLGSVQLEADRPSMAIERLPEFSEEEAEVCRLQVILYKGRVVVLGLRGESGLGAECGPAPSNRK